MDRKKAERGLLLFSFFLFFVLSFVLYDKYTRHSDYCSMVGTICEYSLLKDGCYCEGQKVDLEVVFYTYSDGKIIPMVKKPLNFTQLMIEYERSKL